MSQTSDNPQMNCPAATHEARVAWYRGRIREFDTQIDADSRRWKSLSMVRGLTFLVAVLLLIPGFSTYAGHRALWFVLAGAVFAAFLYIAFIHEGIESRRREKQVWRRLYKWSLARLNRDWDQLKPVAVTIPQEHTGLTNDLDLFGRSSLFQLVGGVETPEGIRLFRDWMLGVPTSEQVTERQAAVAELQSLGDFRDRFRFLCHLLSAGDGGPETLTAWAETPRELDRSGMVVGLARLLAALTAAGLLGMLTGLISIEVAGPFLLIMLAVNFLYTVIFAGRIHTIFNKVSTRHGEIGHYYVAFQTIRDQEFRSPMLVRLKQELFSEKADVLTATDQLGRIAWRANLRRHGILFIAYILLQFGFLWDVHTLRQLQNWRDRHGSFVRRWFEDLGYWEVLAALAQFAVDHVEWVTPQVRDCSKSEVTIACRQLGHPLLDDSARVDNDVQIGPPGSVLLVTGSNMSGKSTLLRAIGLNVVLAHLGAPVCARSMSLSPMRIETSMRIQDSLADGVSFFMAELKRLKQIVDIAQQDEDNPQVTVLFLLDEILQGTNSRERHIAVTRVVRHLVDHHAIGAVSTHDLELGKTGELAKACRPIHFRESFATVDGQKVMTFDYTARDGIATTTNALKLLELVGLDLDPEP
jgi:ABC-type multidrug transport system fused ATPase/permease subunit